MGEDFFFAGGKDGSRLPSQSEPQFLVEIGLGGKVAVDRSGTDACPRGYGLVGNGLIRVLHQQRIGFGEDVCAGCGRVLFPQG